MTRRLSITRRDFLGGVALGTAAGALAPAELLAGTGPAPYPPALTGLRGSHPGAFDVAHALAWAGREYPRPAEPDEAPCDLVVVGGGISGLAAAFYWRQAKGPDARILILDNHDDFGGHARRNEFTVDGELLVGYGGSQSIDTPGKYSPEAARLLRDVGIVTDRFYEYFDQALSERMGLDAGIWFSAEAYGRDVTAPGLDLWRSPDKRLDPAQVAAYPIDDAARAALLDLLGSWRNYLADLAPEARVPWLKRTSYRDFLLGTVGVPEAVYLLFRDQMRGWWGVGWDAVSAAQAADLGMHSISVPQPDLMHSFGLDFPVSMGGVEFARDPGQPTVLHGSYIPAAPDRGLSAVEQHLAGRRAIYELSFDDFERRITRQLDGALGAAGFDVERDLAGLTVNRWPHGYAYEYNELFDPPDWGRDKGPHRLGARQLGRISIANSDASAWAFVDGAIDAAWRATREQLA